MASPTRRLQEGPTVLLTAPEDAVRDSLREITPIVAGTIIAVVSAYLLISSIRGRFGSIIREPVVLILPLIAFGVVTFVAFLVGAGILIALAIGAGAGLALLLLMTG